MKKIIFLLFLSGCFCGAAAQYSFSGTVTNEEGIPLSLATIVFGKKNIALTDSRGNYFFQNDTSYLRLTFIHAGYEPLNINAKTSNQPMMIVLKRFTTLETMIVKAFERNSNINQVPAAVTVLSKATLERYNEQSFVPAINTIPGVKMDERSPGSYRLSIRGNLLRSTFGVRNVKVYWNGIPFTDASGNTYFNQLSPENINKIEIIKGPAGSMYGSGTGGVVLLSSENPEVEEKHLNVNVSAGSYGAFNANASFIQSGINNTGVSFSHQQNDGYRAQSNVRRDVLNYTGSYTLNKKQYININVFYSDLYYQTPGGLTLAEIQSNPAGARPAAGIFPGAETQQAAIYLKTLYTGLSHQYRFNEKWNNTTSVYGSYTDFRNPTIRNYEDKYERGMGARSVLQYKGKLFTHTIGGEYQQGFINTGVYGNRQGTKDTLQYNDEIRSRQYNIFAQTDIAVSKGFSLNAGISYNNFGYRFQRLSDAGTPKESGDFSPQFVPRLAALATVSSFRVYVTVSKGYSPPTIDEIHASDGIFNRALKAETAMNYEIGLKGDVIKNKLWIDACYYIFGLQNTIVSRRDASGADFYVNAGKTKQRGAEAAINYLPINNTGNFITQLKLFVNYTNIHARFGDYQQGTNKYDGNKLTGTAPDVVVSGADIKTNTGVYAHLTYSYTGKIPLNDANTFFAGSYSLYSIKAGYETNIGKATTDIFISYERSADIPYSLGNDLNAAGNRFFNPSAPSVFSVGAKFRFNLKKT